MVGMMMWRQYPRAWIYWLCQIGGWGSFGVILVLFGLLEEDARLGTSVAHNIPFAMLGLLGSHWLRTILKRRLWMRLKARPALLRIIPTTLLVSLIVSIIMAAIVILFMPETIQDDPSFPVPVILTLLILIIWVNFTIMYVGWTAIYLGLKVTERMYELETEQLRLQSAAKEAELKALRAQINPHFLFNALNTVSSLINEDQARANQAVLHLAQMLRYNLRATRAELVPLSQELQVVEGYLALEKIRFEDRLQLHYAIAPLALPGLIPPFLLQHLVENAIKYGISSQAKGGELHVAASVEGAQLVLCVRNPGRMASASVSTGTGLQNAREHLQLLFGDAARLKVANGPDETVIAEARLPLHTELSLLAKPVPA